MLRSRQEGAALQPRIPAEPMGSQASMLWRQSEEKRSDMDIKDVKKVTVAGGGMLGSQIAFQSAYRGYDVTIWLRSEGSIGRCQPKIDRLHETYLASLEALKTDPSAYAYGFMGKDGVSPEKIDEAKAAVEHGYKNLRLTTDWDEAFGDADLVIEAVAEDPAQKTAFYEELKKHLPERTVVATNFLDASAEPVRRSHRTA